MAKEERTRSKGMEERSMKAKVRRIWFTTSQGAEGAHVKYLGKDGRFFAVYVRPDIRVIVGFWSPTWERMQELKLHPEDSPFEVMLHYIPEDEKLEQEYKAARNPQAPWFLEMPWKEYYFEFTQGLRD